MYNWLHFLYIFILTLTPTVLFGKNFERYLAEDVVIPKRRLKDISYAELDPEHESRNYNKTIRWIEKGIIPGFLKEDMKEYMYDDELVIENKSSFLIE